MTNEPLLCISGLRTEFGPPGRSFAAVDGVDLSVARGERVAVVGESGSGKTVTALSVLGLIAETGRISAGEILFEDRNLLKLPKHAMRKIRGGEISMIFQEPMTSLNPVFTVGDQVIEALTIHQGLRGRAARARAAELLALVRVPSPEKRIDNYPHELSGGMRQRVMIAIALSSQPKLLIADEPTTALDVTVQAQILKLLKQLQEELGMAVLLITHDLGVVAQFAERVIVMYAGKIVETAPVLDIFRQPQHPYTEGLLGSIPPLHEDVDELRAIEGVVPPPFAMPAGCRFHPRCAHARAACTERTPPLMPFGDDHKAACIRHTGYGVASG
ncbi:ABC transporter ATP-binding protein [Pikeienuella piscinae]|uniref:ABC transporter ATP-binding protein n=1 Tax=Pikeienuella piscinae TaxID=2748098 RepID=A0A7L5BVU5_9RHOB|nr:ABC transporter ATP-binding protein [Pikeienuella piscinae]QIE55531.1 ABC transporter ATP-binding protein [Pikeienuella piscinae]